MTVSAAARQVTYALAAGVTGYAANFPIAGASDLRVYVHAAIAFDPDAPGVPLTPGVHYTTASAAIGVTVIPTPAMPTTGYVTLYRVTSMAQQADYTPNDGFPAESHEAQLDRLSLVDQELRSDLSALTERALRVPAGETVDPIPAPRLNPLKVLATDAHGAIVWRAPPEDARRPVRLVWTAAAGQTVFPFPAGVRPIDGATAVVTYQGGIIEPERGDWTLAGALGPLVFTSGAEAGDLIALHAELVGGATWSAGEATFAVHDFRQAGDTTDSAAMRRARDAVVAAGGGRVMFEAGKGSRVDGHFLIGEVTQNVDPTNSGNLCSNLTLEQSGGAEIWQDPTKPFAFFHNPVGIGTGAAPNVQGPTLSGLRVGAITVRNDNVALGLAENEAFFHLNGVEDVVFDRTRMIGMRGDGVMLGAGDVGPGAGDGRGRQNRFNRRVTFRDILIDGVNQNNRNGISIVSGEMIRFEGRCLIRNTSRPGGPGPIDPFNIHTGYSMPGGVDIEPNSFTADARVRDITGIIYVEDCGSSALARLMFGQDGLPVKNRGIVMEVHALRCRVGILSFYGGENDQTGTDVTLVNSSATDCNQPFSLIRGRGLRIINSNFYNCAAPADLSYVDNATLKNWVLRDVTFDGCGAAGAVLRALGGDGWDWRGVAFRNCGGALIQILGPATFANSLFDGMKVVKDAGAPLIASGRFVINTEGGAVTLDSASIIERNSVSGGTSDSPAWQVVGTPSRFAPSAHAWKRGNQVPAVEGLEPGSPRGWMAIEDNAAGAAPVFATTAVVPGAAADVAGFGGAVTKTASVVANGNGRYTAARATQSLYDPTAYAVGNGQPGHEAIFAMPYSGNGLIYAGVSASAAPTALADLTAGFAFDSTSGPGVLLLIANGGLYGTVGARAPWVFGGQVRVTTTYSAGAPRATFWRRNLPGDAWTQIDGAAALAGTASLRTFAAFQIASETIQIIKSGTP